jgi:DnaJ-class molecular chaperone
MNRIKEVLCQKCHGSGVRCKEQYHNNDKIIIEKNICDHCNGSGKDILFVRNN